MQEQVTQVQPTQSAKKGNSYPSIKVVNQIQPNPENPIPFQHQSLFYIPSGKSRYIPFFSDTDQFPNLLLEARLLSTTHNDCIDTIAKCTVGNGLYITNNEKPNEDWLRWVKSVNNSGQSLNKVLRNVVDGFETNGNQFIEIVRGKVGSKPFLHIYVHPMQYCRLTEPDERDIPTAVFVSKYFSRNGLLTYRDGLKKAKQIPLWTGNKLDKNWLLNEDKSESTMIHLKNEYGGVDYYGLPASVGSLLYQIKESLMVQYDNDCLNNGMVESGILAIKGSMSRNEAGVVAQDILMTHTGRGKAGRIMVLASEQGIGDVDFKPMDTKREGSYLEADARTEQKIRSANKLPSELSSAINGSGLGKGGDYLLQMWNIFEALKLNPLRAELKESLLSKIQTIYAEHFGAPEVLKYDFGFISSISKLAFLDIDPKLCVTVDEARGWLGLAPDPVNGTKYMGEIGAKQSGGQPNV